MKRKTKIVATISPDLLKRGMIERMIEAEVDVFRLNFSYGSHEEHERMIDFIKETRSKYPRPVAIMQDLSGPRIRIGDFKESEVTLVTGDEFILSLDPNTVGSERSVYIDCPFDIIKEFKEGDRITVSDGEVDLAVSSVQDSEVICKVSRGGRVRSGRGVAVPGKDLPLPSLTDEDIRDLDFGIKHGVDFVALSFVRSASDIILLKELLNERTNHDKPDVVAKIETLKAVENFDSILEVTDAVMVARGDLASEVPPEDVPLLQKSIIKRSNLAGKAVITATQMLESMVNSPVPTRAETSDIANAILDGTDAIMLSAETAIGKYPLMAVNTMVKTSLRIEGNCLKNRSSEEERGKISTVDSVTASAVRVSNDLKAKLIVALTDSGFTGRMISRHRPKVPIVALTASRQTFRKLALSFGCVPMYAKRPETLDDAFSLVREYADRHGLAQSGDTVVAAAGVPFNHPDGRTNMIFVEVL